MYKIAIINGPNLNLLGEREVDIYGNISFEDYLAKLENMHPDVQLSYYQSNVEGELVNHIHTCRETVDGIVFNGAGYTHTSVAIADAIAAIKPPVIEVHISNLYGREDYRKTSLTACNCVGIITGLGLNGYHLAIEHFKHILTSEAP